jgi:hypothetical protein
MCLPLDAVTHGELERLTGGRASIGGPILLHEPFDIVHTVIVIPLKNPAFRLRPFPDHAFAK